MTKGEDRSGRPDFSKLDVDSGGRSAGKPAAGQLEGNSVDPLGNPGMNHWQASYISQDTLGERDNIFFAAIEMTRMPMLITDPRQHDNPVVFANKAFYDMTGYGEAQVLGRNCRFLQGKGTEPATVAEVRQAVHEQRAVAVDILNYKADGSPFWNALYLGPVFSDEGELLYFFSSQMDITERRLSEQSSLQAQKMGAIGQLTAGLAHDFNNLLQVISGNLEMAAMLAQQNSSLMDAIQRAQQAANRGGKLIQQLLTFARKQRLAPKRVNLNTLIVEFSELLVRALGKETTLRLDLRPGLPSCTVDPTHLEMALLNVLINARDAMPGGGEVVVATSTLQIDRQEEARRRDLPPGQYVVLCVIDRGVGMHPDVARRATEPFFTTKTPGTGLGLAMVHGFLQQSHGQLRIDSTPGQGTTVHLIFPATGEPASEPAPVEVPKQSEQPPVILLAEDSDEVRELAEAWLQAFGYRVVSAASGEEALRRLAEVPRIDLLLTDVIMPGGMNGLTLAEQVRQRQPGVPVIVATGYIDELTRRDGNLESFVTMSKPFRRAELEQHVRAALCR